MKKNTKALRKLASVAIPLALSVCAANMYCFSAAASEVSNDGLDAALSLSRGENNSIIVDFSLTNTNNFDIENIKLETYGIDNYELNEEWKLPDTIDIIRSGERFEHSAEYKKPYVDPGGQTWGPTYGYNNKGRSSSGGAMTSRGNSYGASYREGNALSASDRAAKEAAEKNSKNGSSKDGASGSSGNGSTPSTGDTFPLKTIAALAAASGAVMVLCIKTKNGRKVLSLLLVTAAFASYGTQYRTFTAFAEESEEQQTEEDTSAENTEDNTEGNTEENTEENTESAFEEHSFEIETNKIMNNADNHFKVKITYNYPKLEMSGGQVLDVYESMLTSNGTYIIFSKQDKIGGSLEKYGSLKSVSYTITDSEGNELMSGELEPSDTWEIEEPQLLEGENTLTLQLEHEDGTAEDETIKINNISSENTVSEEENEDCDSDGLSDTAEEDYGTDKEKADTDDDGLSDYDEIAILGTDPLKKDTDDNETDDGDEDKDNDGISNYDEVYVHFTDPSSADSDGDGISDNDELNKYRTSPVKADTDGDGASDKWETDNEFDPNKKDDDFGELLPDKSGIVCEKEKVRITDVTGDKLLNSKISGYIGIKPFNIQLNEDEPADITIPLEELELSEKAVPALFCFNKDLSRLVEADMELTADDSEESKVRLSEATAKIEKSGIYIVLDKSKFCRVDREALLDKDSGENSRKNPKLDIILLTDNKKEDEESEKAEIIHTVKKYTGRLHSRQTAAIIKFSASPELPVRKNNE